MSRSGVWLLLAWVSFASTACAARAPRAAEPGSSTGEEVSPDSSPSEGEAGATAQSPSDAPAHPGAAPVTLTPLVTSGPPLPELRVKSFGLHVGGGRNDPSEREPLLRALERQFPRLLECYRLVEEPGKSGSFGVDLHLATQGGAPRVSQPRTGFKGEDFRRCMLRAFESVRFERLERPTVISYSVKFSVGTD